MKTRTSRMVRIHWHDGYRIHINPDNSCVFLEGVPESTSFFWRDWKWDDLNIEIACRRRGLLNLKSNWRLQHHIAKLYRIVRLEQEFCGEPSW